MSRKKLRNQLEDFFDELEIEASIPPEPEPPAAQGWTWECDLHGTITACSPEIQAVLGYSPDDALGQNIGSFALQVESSQQVKKALSQQSFSAEIETCFVTVNGEELPGRIHFLMTEKPGAKNGKPATVKGFTQIEAGPRSSTLEGQNPAIEVNDLPGEAASAEEVISTSEDGFQSESASLAELESIPDLASGEGEKPIEVIPELDPGDDPAAWLAEISYSPAINAEIDPDSIHSDVSFNETLAEAELKLEEDASTEGSSQSGNHFGVEDTRLSGVQPDEDVEVESNAGEQEMPTVQHLEDDGLEEAFDSSEEQSAEPVDELGSGIPHAFTNTENEAGGPVFGESPPVQQSSSTPSPDSQSKTLQMPIRVQNKTRGLLELVDDDPQRQWSSEEQRLVEEVLDQLSLALENAELFQQTQVALSETERLYKISADFNAADTLEEILKSMSVPNDAGVSPFAVTLWQFETDKTGQPVEMTYTNLWAEPGRVVKSHIGTQISLADYSGSRVLLGNPSEPQLIGDTAQDPLDEATREMVLYNAGAAVVFLPLAIREHWIGMINILWDHPTQFNERDRNRYRSLAAQAAITINNRLLFEQTEHRARQLEWLSMIKDSLSQATDEAGILSAVSMALDLAMPPQWIALLYFDLDGMGEIRGARTSAFWKDGMILEAIPEWDTRSFLTTLQSLNIFERFPDRAYVISDARSPEDSPEALRVAAEEQKFRGFGVLPLYSSGRWQGAIAFGWPVVYELSVNEAFYLKEILEPLAAFIASRRSYLAEQEARQAMERRNLQLQTAAQVSRAASSILDPDTLVKDTVEIVKKRFDLYYVGLFLVDQAAPKSKESAGWALLKAGTGEAGRIMLERGHKLEIDGPSMIGKCIALNQAQIWRGDQDEVQYRFSNPLLPDTRSEMALPLVSRGEVMGAMTFQSQQAGDFSEADISVLQTMADQVANAIQNARLYAQSEAALSETSTLYTIASAASRSMELSQMLDEVLFQTLETTNFEAGVISIYNSDANRLELTAHRNLPDELVNRFKLHGLDGTLCALVYNRKEAVAVPNLKENAPLEVQALIELGFQAYQGVPLISKDRILGTLCLFSFNTHASQEADRILMEVIAQQTGVAVDNVKLFEQTQTALSETEILYQASAELNIAQSFDDILQTLARFTVFGNNAQNVSINLFDQPWIENQEPEWINVPARRTSLPESTFAQRYPVAAFPAIRTVLRSDAPSILEDLENETGLDENSRHLYLNQFGAKSTIFVPIVVASQWIGFFNAIYQQASHFTEKDIRRLTAVVNQAAVAIQNLQSLGITRQQARDAMLLYQSSQELVQSKSEIEIFNSALSACQQYGGIDYLSIQEFKEVAGEMFLEQIAHLAPAGVRASEDNTLYPTDLYPYTKRLLLNETIASENIQRDGQFTQAEKELLEQLSIRSLIALPVNKRGQVFGTLMATYQEPHSYSTQEMRFLETVVVQLDIALDNYYLLQETQKRARQLQTAAEVSQATTSILETDELLQKVVDLAQQRFNLYYAGLFLVDQSGEWSGTPNQWAVLRAGTGIAGIQMKAQGHKLAIGQDSMIGRCIASSKASVSFNVTLEPGHYKNPLLPKTISEMALPLIAQGEVIGAMSIQSEHEAAFSEDDIATLQTMADQVAIAIQNARLFGRTQEALSETERLYQASAELNTARTYKEILTATAAHTPVLQGYQALNLYLMERARAGTDSLGQIVLASYLPETEQPPRPIAHTLGELPDADQWLRTGSPVILENLQSTAESQHPLAALYRPNPGVGSALLLPLVVANQAIGFLEVIYTEPRSFQENDLRPLIALAAQSAVAFQNLHSLELAESRAKEALERSQELALINRVVSSVSAHTDLRSALGEVAHELGSALNVQVGIALMNENRSGLMVMAEHLLNESDPSAISFTIPIINNPSTQKVIETRKPLIITDATRNPATSQLHEALAQRGVETLNIFPMVAGSEVIGTIGLDILEKGRTLTENDIGLAETIILQAATAIQNLRLFEQTQEALAESEALYQANAELNSAQTYIEVLDILRNHTILGQGSVYLATGLFDKPWLDEELPEWFIPIAQWGSTPEYQSDATRIALKDWKNAAQLLQPNFPTFITEIETDPRLDEISRSDYLQRYQAHGLLFAPVNVAGRWIGHIHGIYQTALEFSETELRRLTTLVGQAAVVIQNIRNAELTRQRAGQLEKLAMVQAALSQAGNEREILSALVLPTDPHNSPRTITLEYVHNGEQDEADWLELVAQWEDGVNQNMAHLRRTPFLQAPLYRLWTETPDETLFISDINSDSRIDEEQRKFLKSKNERALAIIPLRSGGIWQGVVTYSWPSEYEFSANEQFLLRRLIEPASEVIARRKAFISQRQARQESERRAIQLQTAAEIARETTGTLSLNELLSRAVTLMSSRYGYYHAGIFLVDEHTNQAQVRAAAGAASVELLDQEWSIPVGSTTMVGYVTQTGETLLVNNLRTEPRFQPHPLLPNTGAELTIPMKIGERVIGALDVQSEKTEAFGAEDASVLQVLADQLAVAVDNARSYEMANQAFQQARQRAQEMTLLFNVSQALASAPMASEEIALIVTEQFARVLEVPECSLAMLYSDENGNALRVLGAYGSANHPKQNRLNTSYFLADQPIVHKAVQSLQPVVAQAGDDTLSKDAQHYLRKHGIQTLLAIPLAVKGEAIGVIELTSHQWPRYYSADQLNLAMTLANAAAVALENARLYEDQRQTAERLQEVDHLKTQFLANMSHELRTPLNSIIGFSRVILKGIDGPTTDLQQQDLTAIYSSGQHLLSLINDILDLSKIEAGKMELAIEEVDLNDMINSVMSTAVGLTKEKPIELERNVEPDLPLVQVDRTRIRQVLINLISNAAKFTDEGFIRVSAHLQKDASSNPEIWIGVTDSGPGIEIDDQDKLFKAFSQVDASPTRKSGGTGLGLSISRHLVELHKGQIGVESEPGQGSTFFFTLPLPNTEHFELPTLNIDGPVILSIDDNRQVISLYERYLGNHNYHVYPLTEPEMAIQLARQMQPFAITLDIMMPGQDGWSILQQLKQDPETRNIPVIICSILEDQDKGFSLGAADYLVKPILEEDLVHSIRRINQDDSIHKILVVDDDADDLRLVQKILEQEGNYIVELAQGGQEALVRLEEEPPHAIILDLYMPGLDGFSLLDTVRANPRIRDIPVIIFSGGDLDEDQRKKLAQAGQEILQKSLFTEDELLSTLERSLRRFAQSNQTPVL